MEYYQTLKKLHQVLRPNLYLEVGIRAGESFQMAFGKTKCIGIDPAYDMQYPYLKSSLLVRDTSDNFFAKRANTKMFDHEKIDFAFIDGMHLFEYALRDFINIEKHAKPGTVIAIHDCVVKDKATSTRERNTSFWTGDVWKVVKVLERYRPDLKIIVLDIAPTGLVLITNLNPSSRVLASKYKGIEKEYIAREFTEKDRLKTVDTSTFDFSSLLTKKPAKPRTFKLPMRGPQALGVLLCYNDADILADVIEHLLSNKHELIVWDHGSDDGTAEVLEKYQNRLVEYKFVPRKFDFYKLYGAMSKNLIENYIQDYDWISWPDQDEILEGPNRKKSYYKYITKVYRSKYNWIQFRNFNFWFTEADDKTILSPTQRIKFYSLFPDVSPRIRSWRASVTNIRRFNHNKLDGERYPELFNLRHYPMRSAAQMKRRLMKDRADIQKDEQNFHYNVMQKKKDALKIKSKALHRDDGSELELDVKFDWNNIYRDKSN